MSQHLAVARPAVGLACCLFDAWSEGRIRQIALIALIAGANHCAAGDRGRDYGGKPGAGKGSPERRGRGRRAGDACVVPDGR